MIKIKQQKDGKYYEKIVSYKKEPDWWSFFGACWIFGLGVFGLISFIWEYGWRFVGFGIIFLILMGCVIGGILALWFFKGVGRKIKFKRINP